MKDWNEFMRSWNELHRNKVLPYMRQATKKERYEMNLLISDIRSSLKWCRFEDCKSVFESIKKVVINISETTKPSK